MFVELAGMVGAGKSTVVPTLERLLRDADYDVLSLDQAMQRCVRRSRLGKMMLALSGASQHASRIQRLCIRPIVLIYTIHFISNHLRLSGHVARSQIHRDISMSHRRRILRLFFDVAARYWFLRGRLRPSEAVIVDEGLLHRAINLYAWEPRQLDRQTVIAYFSLLPTMELAILVRAPLSICLERATRRGLPIRLRDKDPWVITTFMRQSSTIVDIASDFLAASGRASIELDNTTDIDSALARLQRDCVELLQAQPTHESRSMEYLHLAVANDTGAER